MAVKKIAGYAATFIAGTFISGTVAIAATNYVQASMKNSTVSLNGDTIQRAPALVYGGTTYVQLYSVQQALRKIGVQNSWNGNDLSITSQSQVKGSGTSGTSSQSSVTVTNKDADRFVANANGYKNDSVNFTGKIFSQPYYEKSDNITVYNVYLDPLNLRDAILVGVTGSPQLQEDNYIDFQGIGYGTVNGTNSFGATVTDPYVKANSVTTITRDQAVSPTLATSTGIQPQTQNGLTLQVDKVEYAANATRVYVTLTNNTNANASVFSYESTLVQGNSQLQSNDLDPDSSNFPNPIANGVVSHGEWVFGAANISGPSMTLTIKAQTDDYTQNYTPFVFTVPAPTTP